MASSRARSTKRGTRPRTARVAPASCENPTRSKPPDGAAAPISMDKVGRETMPTTTEAPSALATFSARTSAGVGVAIRGGAACGAPSTARCPFGADRVRCVASRRRSQERKHGLASRSRGGLPAPWSSAATDAGALAIAHEAAASGRRPGAAAVRPQRNRFPAGVGLLLPMAARGPAYATSRAATSWRAITTMLFSQAKRRSRQSRTRDTRISSTPGASLTCLKVGLVLTQHQRLEPASRPTMRCRSA